MSNLKSPPDPVQVSWSSLKRWENCPQHQLRVITHQTVDNSKGRIFLPGTVLDLTMRRWLESDNPQPGEMVDMVEVVFNDVLNKGENPINWMGNPNTDRDNVKRDVREAAINLEPWLMENVLPYDYQPEMKFTSFMQVPYICDDAFGLVKMIGGIDVIVRRDDGKFRLYDLKMTKNASYIKMTLAQLIFYDLAWGVIQGDFHTCVDWGYITPALEEKFISIQVDSEDRRLMLSRIIKFAQGFWNDSWEPKPDDDGCNWCEARAMCQKFKQVSIVDENGKQKMSFNQAAAQRAQFRKP